MRRKFALSLAAVALIFLLAAWYLWGSRRAPQGQPPLLSLTQSNVDQFRNDFDAAGDNTRLLVLLSPT